jgi:hypothetical protein
MNSWGGYVESLNLKTAVEAANELNKHEFKGGVRIHCDLGMHDGV